LLQAANVQISMDGKGRALDNIFTERLWRTVKYEEVYIHEYTSPREARQALTRYFARFIIMSAFTKHSITRSLLTCIFTQEQLGKGRTNSI
jgi:transposase InsO family protein